jgi:3-oxoacyl-[acyl-carrier protein] reductase
MSEKELDGRVALITGGARNIGRAIALDLADGGADVVVVARSDVKGLRSTAADIEAKGCKALALQVDVTNGADVQRMVDETLEKFGRLDILVNNAGIRPQAAVEDLSLQAWREVMAVSLDGAFLCIKAALPALEKTKGTIVNIGGLTAYTGAVHRAHVVAAKAGLDGLTKALAVELAPRRITVNLVAPGEGAEPTHRKSRTMLASRRGRPDDVSAMVRFLVGPKGHYLTGQTIHVSGGAVLP